MILRLINLPKENGNIHVGDVAYFRVDEDLHVGEVLWVEVQLFLQDAFSNLASKVVFDGVFPVRASEPAAALILESPGSGPAIKEGPEHS